MGIVSPLVFPIVVPFPPTNVQLNLKFVDGDVNISATWMVSNNNMYNNRAHTCTILCCLQCVYSFMHWNMPVTHVAINCYQICKTYLMTVSKYSTMDIQ